jgi:protease PrsW
VFGRAAVVEVPSVVILVAAAFVPAIVFLIYIRNQETHGREPWSQIIRAFLFGAVFSVLLALLLETVLHTESEREYIIGGQPVTVPAVVFLVVVIAPLVEEFAKGLGVRGSKRHITEEEDGIVYGAAVGFGFAATENLFYELQALQEHGEAAFIATAAVRAITGNFLHATASGILGYGIGRMYRQRRTILSLIPYFFAAVLLHALFNLLAVLTLGAAVVITLIFAFLAMRYTVRRIRRLDQVPEFIPGGPPP